MSFSLKKFLIAKKCFHLQYAQKNIGYSFFGKFHYSATPRNDFRLTTDFFHDGQTIRMVDGTNVTFSVKGTDVFVDGNKILRSIKASNDWIHVIDTVILPK